MNSFSKKIRIWPLVLCFFNLYAFETSMAVTDEQTFVTRVAEHREICPVKTPEVSSSDRHHNCCGFCNEEPHCERLGNCCLGYYDSFSQGIKAGDNYRYVCVELQYISKGSKFQTEDKAWMIGRCPPDVKGTTNAKLCENPGQDDILDTVVPVTDVASNTHYRNIYCALCSGLSDSAALVSWKLEVHNEIYLSVPDKNLLTKLRQYQGNIFFKPPSFVAVEACFFENTYQITRCNVSGLWPVYNRSLELACNAFTDPFNHTYKNYFCFLCNSPTPTHPLPIANWTCLSQSGNIKDLSPPFFALLDVSDAAGRENEEMLVCSSDQFADHKKMVCRDVYCNEKRKLNGGVCQTRESEVTRRGCFSIFLKLTPVNDTYTIINDLYILHLFRNFLSQTIDYFESMESNILAYGLPDSLDTMNYIVVLLVVDISKVSVIEDTVINALFALDKTYVILEGDMVIALNVELALFDINFSNNDTYINITDKQDFSVATNFFLFDRPNRNLTCKTNETLSLTRLYLRPFVKLNISEITLRIVNDIAIINGGWSDTTDDIVLSKWEYEIHEDMIFLGIDTYTNIYNKIPTNSDKVKVEPQDKVAAKEIVSFACVCLSIGCLLVTLITYLRFPVLQSQPGINTIILCGSLLLAQAMYQFGAGQRSLSDWACALIGALCHFLWLSVMFAMNACSVHMFIIFKKHRRMSPKFSWQITAKNMLFIIGFSFLFVIVNIVASFAIRNDKYGGYGGRVCYISSNTMQIITFLIPAAVTILANLLLFAYVVLRISKISTASTKLNHERSYFLVYARLSTLTGLTWIFGFLQLFLKSEVLEYIFIILNAGQGIFIMIAFVLNKRVFPLYFAKRKAVVSDNTGSANIPVKSSEATKH